MYGCGGHCLPVGFPKIRLLRAGRPASHTCRTAAQHIHSVTARSSHICLRGVADFAACEQKHSRHILNVRTETPRIMSIGQRENCTRVIPPFTLYVYMEHIFAHARALIPLPGQVYYFGRADVMINLIFREMSATVFGVWG